MLLRPQIILLIATMSLFMKSPADAAPITGRAVKTWIDDAKALDQKSPENQSYNAGKLHGYLSGLADAMAQTRAFCPPNGLPHKELLNIVDKHLEYDYANRDKPATPRLMQLFRQTYPCSSGIKKTPRQNPDSRPNLNSRQNKEQST